MQNERPDTHGIFEELFSPDEIIELQKNGDYKLIYNYKKFMGVHIHPSKSLLR